MSVVEGSGNFDCTQESSGCDKHPFKTTKLSELHEHYKQPGHYLVNGGAECSVCGNGFTYEKMPHGVKPVCDNCGGMPEVKPTLLPGEGGSERVYIEKGKKKK